MLIHTERTKLLQTRQRVEFVCRGKEMGRTFLVIGPASDGTWMFKEVGAPDWDAVDTAGECHSRFYDGRARTVQQLELVAYKQHLHQLAQNRLF
jgi:hypothetical protein